MRHIFSLRVLSRVLLACFLLACVSPNATGTTVIPPTFDELVAKATEIFVGTVVNRESRFVQGPTGNSIVTLVTFTIEETLKGSVQGQTMLQFRGGTVGDLTLHVAEMPEFHIGERAVLFVGDRKNVSPLVGFMHGRFPIERESSGREMARSHDGRPLKQSDLGSAAARAGGDDHDLTLPEVRAEIQRRLRSR